MDVCHAKYFSQWSKVHNLEHHMGGRLWVLWRPNEYEVEVLDSGDQWLHLTVCKLDSREQFCVTVVYAHNAQQARLPLWNKLQLISQTMTKPWLVGGDFNNVLATTERIGGQLVQATEIQPFYDCIVQCRLQDMRHRGALYTWNNRQDPPHRICAKLDRTLINGNWLQMYPEAETWGLQEGMSDHCPLLITLSLATRLAPRHFKYCNMWALHPQFRTLVLRAWHSGFFFVIGSGSIMFCVNLSW